MKVAILDIDVIKFWGHLRDIFNVLHPIITIKSIETDMRRLGLEDTLLRFEAMEWFIVFYNHVFLELVT